MNVNEDQGRRLLSAVERILDDNDDIAGRVSRYEACAREKHPEPEQTVLRREAVCDAIITYYSNLSAASGGLTALPACVPGVGTLLAVGGGALVDMALILKFEVEMALALACAHGLDITDERERQLAFLLASVATHDARSGRNFFADMAEAQGVAIQNYAPRELTKLLVAVLARLALRQVSKSAIRAIPLLGIGIGVGLNKALTLRVGRRIRSELGRRMELDAATAEEPEDIVDARIVRD